MDANGQRFFQLADATDFAGPAVDVAFDTAKRRLRLASARTGPAPRPVTKERALELVLRVPGALDAFGTYALWDPAAMRVRAAGALEDPGDRELRKAMRGEPVDLHPPSHQAPLTEAPTDICLGGNGVVALAIGGVVTLLDTREHFPPTPVPLDGFAVFRIAGAKGQGFVAMDREARSFARLTGTPTSDLPPEAHAPGVFRPCRENPDPPVWRAIPSPAWSADEAPVALAMSAEGAIVVLSWDANGDARLRVRQAGATVWQGPFQVTAGFPSRTTSSTPISSPAPWAMSLAFVGKDRLAVLVPGLFVDPMEVEPGQAAPRDVSEALVFAWPLAPRGVGSASPDLLPLGDFYPLTDPRLPRLDRDHAEPLLRGPSGEAGYLTSAGPRALAPLSKKGMPARGRVRARVLDSQAVGTAWHRLHVEASIPDGCGVRVWLAATNGGDPPGDDAFFPHDFGHVPEPARDLRPADVPKGACMSVRSELPFEEGFLGCEPDPPRSGLFTALVQRAGLAVRTLAGRRLHVRVELFGTGTHGPEIAAIRVYSPRFSYVDEYLPELYAEDVFGPDGDRAGAATGADFLGRLLAIAESELTPMEDRVASAYLLSDARKTPDEALDWLASWIGFALDPDFSADLRRALLLVAPALARRHGTREGLAMALDAVTGGGVSSGRLVIVEDFRLRRVFATILGTHLEEQDDPLLPGGLIISGNSYVGDTLFLGEPTHEAIVELAALYRATFADEAAEEALGADHADPLDGFYERFAYRVTLLVHEEASARERALIERVVKMEAPAHVEVRVVKARWPFLVGMASLVGVDSYLREPVGLEGFRLDAIANGEHTGSALGEKDVLRRPPSLDPRLEGSSPEETS